jgi:hypothetical protein
MRHFTFAFIALFLVSCSGPKSLQSSLLKFNSSIGYLHDSPKSSCPRNNQVYVILNNNPLDSITKVSKLHSLVLPFIFFNHFESTMKVKLGQRSIQEDYNSFFVNSLEDESQRSGCFSIPKVLTNDSIYTLELTIDTCSTISKYRKSYTFMYLVFAYSSMYSESGSPAETNLQVTAKFRKGDSLVYEKKYSINHSQPFVNQRLINSNNLRSDFTTNMVEGLSLSTKECIEKIVADININLYGSARPLLQMDVDTVTSNPATEVIPEPLNDVQPMVNNQNIIPKVENTQNQLNVGDKVKFFNYNMNSYLDGVIKEINGETVLVEYKSFGKVKTTKSKRSDIKKL